MNPQTSIITLSEKYGFYFDEDDVRGSMEDLELYYNQQEAKADEDSCIIWNLRVVILREIIDSLKKSFR